jgi:hypothetical protein
MTSSETNYITAAQRGMTRSLVIYSFGTRCSCRPLHRRRSAAALRLVAGARILRADNGAEVTCDELQRIGERPLVWMLDERKRLVARREPT